MRAASYVCELRPALNVPIFNGKGRCYAVSLFCRIGPGANLGISKHLTQFY